MNSQAKNLLQVFIIVFAVLLIGVLAIIILSWLGFSNSEEEAQELNQQALKLERTGKNDDALRTYDEIIKRYGESQNSDVIRQVIYALLNKGRLFEKCDKHEEAIEAYNCVVTRLSDTKGSSLKYLVIEALLEKGYLLGRLGKYEEAIAAYEAGISRYDEEWKLNYSNLALALIEKAALFDKWGKHEESIKTYNEVVTRFGSDEYPMEWDTVAMALNHKGAVFERSIKYEEAISAYDDVLTRFWDAEKLAIKTEITDVFISKEDKPVEDKAPGTAKKWGEKAMTYVSGDDPTTTWYHAPGSVVEAISRPFSEFSRVFESRKEMTYDDFVKYYGKKHYMEIRRQVVDALSNKGLCLIKLGKQEQDADKKQARYSEGIALVQQAIDDTLDSLQRDGISLHWLLKKEENSSKRQSMQQTLMKQNAVLGRQYYNFACARILSESLDAGFDQLTDCLKQKQITWTEVEDDPTWDTVREYPRYQELQREYGGEGSKKIVRTQRWVPHSLHPPYSVSRRTIPVSVYLRYRLW
jgi:tetratricopeptide (TPR) repeat protein